MRLPVAPLAVAFVSCVACVSFVAGPALAQDRGPYLQQGTPDSMMVVWRTASAAESVVCWGTDPDDLSSTASDPGTRTQHEVRIDGLSPGTRYWYSVGGTSCPPASSDPDHYFVTAPEPGARTPFRFWVVGDSGTGGSRQAQVTEAMLTWVGDARPDIYLHMGDMAYSDGTTQEFDDNFFAMYEGILENTVCWPTMGNHEGHTSESASESGPYYDAYALPRTGEAGGLASGTEAYYSFDYANVHFVVLESHQSSRDVGGAMLTWLDEDLAATDQEWIVAYWHHPAYTKGSHDSDDEGSLIDMRENALPILEAWGVDLVLAGHSHIYERSQLVHGAYDTPTVADGHIVDPGDGQLDGDGAYDAAGDGAVYVVAGHGGAGVSGTADHPLMYFSELDNGSCIVDVNGGSLTLTNIRRDGAVTDTVTLVKEDGVFLTSPLGGERFLAGSVVDVTWSSVGDTAAVRLEYSLDGGEHWAVMTPDTANDGFHAWTTPENLTTEARVRVIDTDDAAKTSESGDFELASTAWTDPITFGGIWEYHDQGVDQGDAWRTEHGGWETGAAQLGYGDGDEATVLRDEDPNIPTVYFRSMIELDTEVTAARLRVLYDDAATVWINGSEVLSRNMVDGTDFALYASGSSGDDATEEVDVDLAGDNPFVIGENVIAVMVKQSSEGSSDLSFDLGLSVEVSAGDLEPEPWPPVVEEDGGVRPGTDGAVPGTDGGGGPGVSPSGGEGCGCRAVTARSLPWPVFFALILVAWRRRRS